MDPMRPKQDSGLIDILAMQRQAQEERRAAESIPAPAPLSLAPYALDAALGGDEELDAMAAAMKRSPLSKIPKKFLVAGGAVAGFLLLVLGVVAVTGGGDDEPTASAGAEAPLAMAAAAAPPAPAFDERVPPPPPAIEEPEPEPVKAKPAAKVAPKRAKKPGKAHRRGPKLMKIQSGGT